MISFDLSPADRDIVRQAREEARIGRGYARYFDQNESLHEPPADVDLPFAQSPRQLLADRLDETSGHHVVDALITLEEQWGDVLVRDNELGIGSLIIAAGGTAAMQEEWQGKVLSISMTEPGAGSDPSRMQMVVGQDAATGEWILNGEKVYVSQGAAAHGVVVVAKVKEDDGRIAIGTFLVPKGTPGFTVLGQVHKMGVRCWDTVDYLFEDCRIPADHRLYADFKKTMAAFNNTRPLMAARALGVARAALDLTGEALEAAGIDMDGDRPAMHRTAAADRLLRLEALYDASWLTLIRAKWIEDQTGGAKIEASMSKAKGGLAARQILRGCIDLLGPMAVSETELLEKWYRDCRVFDIFEGPGDIQRLIIARQLLGYSGRELS